MVQYIYDYMNAAGKKIFICDTNKKKGVKNLDFVMNLFIF